MQVLPNEDQAEYEGLYQRFIDAEKPSDAVEHERVANKAHRRLSPVVRGKSAEAVPQKKLLRIRKERDLAAGGFESQKRAQAEAEQRAERQTERKELHQYRLPTAQMQLERQPKRSGKPDFTIQASETPETPERKDEESQKPPPTITTSPHAPRPTPQLRPNTHRNQPARRSNVAVGCHFNLDTGI